MYKRAIIVDDDEIKLNSIKQAILDYDDKIEICTFAAGNPALRYIYHELSEDDRKDTILFLDWNFPNLMGEFPKPNGDLFLKRLYHHDNMMDTVIVSSDTITLVDDESSSMVLGSILYNSSVLVYGDIVSYLS